MIETPDHLIDELGGNQAVAALLDVKHNTVSGWRIRGLPAWTHTALRELVEARGLTVISAVFAAQKPGRRAA